MKKRGHTTRRSIKTLLTALALAGAMAGTAQAALVDIGTATYKVGTQNLGNYNLVYDAGNSLVWLDLTSGTGGNWAFANTWLTGINKAGVLTYNLDPGYKNINVVSNWRLPTSVVNGESYGYSGTTALGYNIATSELGNLFYNELGDRSHYDTSGNLQSSYGYTANPYFQHLANVEYWSGTQDAAVTLSGKYYFAFDIRDGAQYAVKSNTTGFYGIAVQSAPAVTTPRNSI